MQEPRFRVTKSGLCRLKASGKWARQLCATTPTHGPDAPHSSAMRIVSRRAVKLRRARPRWRRSQRGNDVDKSRASFRPGGVSNRSWERVTSPLALIADAGAAPDGHAHAGIGLLVTAPVPVLSGRRRTPRIIETIWTVYETPGDLTRLAVGFAVCLWIVIHLFLVHRTQ